MVTNVTIFYFSLTGIPRFQYFTLISSNQMILIDETYSSIDRFHHFRSFFNHQSHHSGRLRQFFPIHLNAKNGWSM